MISDDDNNNYKDEQDNDTNNEDKEPSDSIKLDKLVYGYNNEKHREISYRIKRRDSDSSKANSCQSYKSSEACTNNQNTFGNNLRDELHRNAVPRTVNYLDPCERTLHKIVTNTLTYYQFNDNYSTDRVMNIFGEYNLLQYASLCTNDSDPRMLNSIIDLGEYTIARLYNKQKKSKEAKKGEFDDIESGAQRDLESAQDKKKKQRYSDLTFLPPRPNKYLDVLTYSE
jgi:hypothetical protein